MNPTKIDRIDSKANITEHRTTDGVTTLCGLRLLVTQPPCGNKPCRRCARIASATASQAVVG